MARVSGIGIHIRRVIHIKVSVNLGLQELKYRHKRRRCQDINWKRDETMKSKYDGRSLGLEGGPSSVVSQSNSSCSSTFETPTIIEEHNGGVLERFPSFAIGFAGILLRVAKHGDQWTALQLVGLLNKPSYDLITLKWHIENVKDCKDATTRYTKDLVKNYGFRRVSERGELEKETAEWHRRCRMWLRCSKKELNFVEKILFCSV